MKEKILQALKTKHSETIKSLGLGDKSLLGIASMLAITITEEGQIETVVSSDGVVDALKGVQSEMDSRVTEAVKKAKSEKKEKVDPDKDTTNPDGKGQDDKDDTPSWAKGLIEKLEKTSQELENIKREKTEKTLAERIMNSLKEKSVDEDYIIEQLEGRSFNSEEDAESFAARVESGWTKIKQKLTDESLEKSASNYTVPTGTDETPFQAMLKAAASSVKAKE